MINTPMLFAFSQSEYETRCRNAKVVYDATIELPEAPNERGAIRSFVIEHVPVGFEEYHRLRKQGYQPLPETSPLSGVSVMGNSVVTMYMVKPLRTQEAELQEIYDQIRVEYTQFLEQALEDEIERQIMLAQAAAERKRIEDEQAAQVAIAEQVRADLAASRLALRERLISEGRLNAAGEAQ